MRGNLERSQNSSADKQAGRRVVDAGGGGESRSNTKRKSELKTQEVVEGSRCVGATRAGRECARRRRPSRDPRRRAKHCTTRPGPLAVQVGGRKGERLCPTYARRDSIPEKQGDYMPRAWLAGQAGAAGQRCAKLPTWHGRLPTNSRRRRPQETTRKGKKIRRVIAAPGSQMRARWACGLSPWQRPPERLRRRRPLSRRSTPASAGAASSSSLQCLAGGARPRPAGGWECRAQRNGPLIYRHCFPAQCRE